MTLINDDEKIELEILELKKKLDKVIKDSVPTIFDKSFWEGEVLDWAMKDSSFKVDLLRFIDVLPHLKTSKQITTHLNEYLLRSGRELPKIISIATKAASNWFTSGMSGFVIKKGASTIAERFIIGNSPEETLPKIRSLHDDGIGFTLDILGEATLSNSESKTYQQRYIDLIDIVSKEVQSWPANESLGNDYKGPIPVANVSIKISAMDPQLDSLDPAGSVSRLKKMVLPILLLAKGKNVFVNFDMEQWEYHEITYNLFEELITTDELKNWPHLGIVIQAYLKESEKDYERLLSLAKSRGTAITVRLVKGAYWDFEVVNALRNNLPSPVYMQKESSDASYEQLTQKLLESVDYLRPAFGSHNHRSLLHAIATANILRVPNDAYEIQMLYGMAEPERMAFKTLASRLRLYAPIGELLPGIGYLVRRLLENMSNSGFLRMSYYEETNMIKLLAKPKFFKKENITKQTDSLFQNAPFADFTNKEIRSKYISAIGNIKKLLPIKVPVVIDGRRRFDGDVSKTFCPSEKEKLVATVFVSNESEANSAVTAAMGAYPAWRDTKLENRCKILLKLADLLDKNRADIAALEALEVAKPIREADADVAEAIDFCCYYAARAKLELTPQKTGDIAGEDNILFYEGRGPTVIIAPWNFPAAILCGMASAALVAGNPVILKPSRKSSAVAYRVYQLMIEAGFPSSVIHFLPGAGELVGDYLVKHPLVAQIAFTGSKEVGLSIIEKAAKVIEGQPQVKRVVCEMGGKNAIIVDDDADIDEAVLGVMQSAFGYAGQKCSACSRVIVVGNQTYRNFKDRLVEACKSIIVAPADKPECRLGPVVDKVAYERLMNVIENPGKGANQLFVGDIRGDLGSYFIPPALFEVKDVKHPLMQQEFFGPIVALMEVETFEDALDVATSTEFALTGGVFSRSPKHLELAKQKFRVGNLYLNRNITGAFVSRQPFGGFGMSGIGTKAGGPNYLLNFAEPRSISENSMRRGYAPEVEDL